MHTGIAQIPVCIRGLRVMRFPYAYGDLYDLRMHTGIDFDPCMHTGIAWHAIPVCIGGFN
jgi:hypothetical protein